MPDRKFTEFALATNYQTKEQIDDGEPTGLTNWPDSVLTHDASTRTISMAPLSGSYELFCSGKPYIKTGTDSVVFSDDEGMHFVYFDGTSGTLKDTQTWDNKGFLLGPHSLVAIFGWDATNKEFIGGSIQNERHGLMDGRVHARLHFRDGLVVLNGMSLTTFDTSGDGSNITCAQWGRAAGQIADEDIMPTVLARPSTTSTPVIYLSGSTPDWRNGTPTASTCLLNGGTGRLMYNKNTGGVLSLAEVPEGYYVNYHSFVTTMNDAGKEEFTVPGQTVYASKSDAIVGQLEEVFGLVDSSGNNIIFHEYHCIGSVCLHTSDAYTNAAKAVTVEIGGGRKWLDCRFKELGSGQTNRDLIIPPVLTRMVTADTTFSESDMEISFDTTDGTILAILPTISGLTRTDRSWLVQKISFDDNPVFFKLETDSDSAGGVDYHAFRLDVPGMAIRVSMTEEGKYTFMVLGSAESLVAHPSVLTLTPELDGTTLTCNGDLPDIAAESTVNVYFRYREIGTLTWSLSEETSMTAANFFQHEVDVDEDVDQEVQAIVKDANGFLVYGDVKNTLANYYPDIASAKADSMLAYWPMQETAGIDTEAVEKLYGDYPMVCSGGVTIASETINTSTIYRRVFGSGARMESAFSFDAQGNTFTIMIRCNLRTTSGDHTLISTGQNKLSVAADNNDIQVETAGGNKVWEDAIDATNGTGSICMFIKANATTGKTRMYTASSVAVVTRTDDDDLPDAILDYIRLADGTNGDSNHQEGETLDDGDIGLLGFWGKHLSRNEMKDLAKTITVKGMLVV